MAVNNKKKIIIDTGPLIAYLNKSDHYHEWALTQFSIMRPPFYTCEAVLSESCFLLRNYQNSTANIFKLMERELIKIPFRLQDEVSAIINLMNKYRDIPMSFADSCLVRMSEQISDSIICTLDSDFKIYRKNNRKIIPVSIPENI